MINIAIVSKDIVFISLLQSFLSRKIPTCNVFQYSSFPEVKEKLEGELFDFIIVDGIVSGVASFEIINYLRLDKNITIPIYFFSEVRTESFKLKAYETGVNYYYEKPFDPHFVTNHMMNSVLQIAN